MSISFGSLSAIRQGTSRAAVRARVDAAASCCRFALRARVARQPLAQSLVGSDNDRTPSRRDRSAPGAIVRSAGDAAFASRLRRSSAIW